MGHETGPLMARCALALYFWVGGIIACGFDRDQMKRPVPYGEFPALLPLGRLRCAVFMFFVLFGLPSALAAIASMLRTKWRAARFRRRWYRRHP